jgi:hypothetical protein
MMSTRPFVFSGTPDQASGGETFCPSQVYFEGIDAPSAKAGDVKRKVMLDSLARRAVLASIARVAAAIRNALPACREKPTLRSIQLPSDDALPTNA